MYEYKAKILRVVDGDTVDVDIDLGFGVWLHRERVRMMGIDTPESRTRDLMEKQFGLLAKEYVKAYLPIGKMSVLKREHFLSSYNTSPSLACRTFVCVHAT